jgi:nucleotide-binding universal stress UspA family protein
MLPIRTILHPTDFSERSNYAFQLACSLARDHGARLLVLHVLQPPAVAYGGVITELATEAAKQTLAEKLRQIQAPDPNVYMEHQLIEGEPATQILHTAEKHPCDLIVMGTHGRTGLRRALMGSVAEQVVRQAPCPVLTVKAPFPPGETSAGPAARESQAAV